MFEEQAAVNSGLQVRLQCREARNQMLDELKNHPHREAIEDLLSTDYKRERVNGREVILLSHTTLKVVGGWIEPSHELRLDVQKALAQFTRIERNVLIRVLIEQRPLADATRYCKTKTQRQWYRWYYEKALPFLRQALQEYKH